MFFIILNCVFSNQCFRVGPWQLSVPFDHFNFNDVWSEYESVFNHLVSASVRDSGVMISAVILSTNPAIQGFQQYASEGGLRKQDHGNRSNTPTVTAVDN